MDYEVTKRLLGALEQTGVRYAVFGAVAMNLHGLPDATFHIDILTRLGEAYAFADLQVERVPLDELTVTVSC